MTERMSRVVETAAGRFDVTEAGTGTPVVLLHGALVGRELWDPLVDELVPRGYRCLAPTLPLGAHRHPVNPGVDLSPPGLAVLIADLIRALDVAPAAVVSNDTATALVQLVLADIPGVVARAVLTSGDSFDYFFPPMFRPLQWAGRVPGSMRAIAWGIRQRAIRQSPLGFRTLTRRGISDELAYAWSAPLLADSGVRRDAAAFLRAVDNRYTLEVVERLRRVDVPVLLAWSEDDRAFPRRYADRLAAAIPAATVEIVEDSATYSAIDNPKRLAELIDGFLR